MKGYWRQKRYFKNPDIILSITSDTFNWLAS